MRARFLVSLGLTDLLMLAISLGISSLIVFGTLLPWSDGAVGFEVLPLVSFLFASAVALSLATVRMAGPGVPRPSYGRAVIVVFGTLVMTALALLATRSYFSRALLGYTTLFWFIGAVTQRAVRRRLPWTEMVAVVSSEKGLVGDLDGAPHVDVVETIDPNSEGEIDLMPPGTTIAVDIRAVLSERVAQYVSSCNIAGYAVVPFTEFYEEHTGRVPLVHLAEGWEISAPLLNGTPWLGGKRVFDVVATVLTAPLWIVLGGLVAAVVALSSPGPVLFKQERVGRDGNTFTMVKFRTMRRDAEAHGPRFAVPNDDRLIRGGSLLRRTRLDEIPQLWNVLRGEMSIVGPRAEQVPFVERFRREIPFYDQRHLVRPGLTGWAQVNYRYADDTADTIEKLTFDLFYVKHLSPVLDLQILWKSVWTIVTGAGAR